MPRGGERLPAQRHSQITWNNGLTNRLKSSAPAAIAAGAALFLVTDVGTPGSSKWGAALTKPELFSPLVHLAHLRHGEQGENL